MLKLKVLLPLLLSYLVFNSNPIFASAKATACEDAADAYLFIWGLSPELLNKSLKLAGLSPRQRLSLIQREPDTLGALLDKDARVDLGKLIRRAIAREQLTTLRYLAYVKRLDIAKYDTAACVECNGAMQNGSEALREFLVKQGFRER